MTKKKLHGGILSCDPSFKGCAFAIYSPAYTLFATEKFDIRGDVKAFDKLPALSIMVAELMYALLASFDPFIWNCDIFVIEGQFTTAMKRLRDMICAAVTTMFRVKGRQPPQVISVAANTWRTYYDLGAETYRKRKQRSVDYFSENPKLIGWSEDIKDDDRAECILILNYLVQTKSLRFHEPYDSDIKTMSYQNYAECGEQCTIKTTSPTNKTNPNKHYWACTNTECNKVKKSIADNFGKSAFICFFGDEPKSFSGNKRTADTAEIKIAPPAPKKHMMQSPQKMPQISDHMLLAELQAIREILVDLKEFIKPGVTALVTNTNDMVQRLPMPAEPEEMEDPGGLYCYDPSLMVSKNK